MAAHPLRAAPRLGARPWLPALATTLLLAGSAGARAASPVPPTLPAGARAVRLDVEPDDGVRVLSRAILRARHSIVLEMYLLTDRPLLHDLERAAAHGVAVRVILDRQPYGSGANPNVYAYDNLLAAEIPTHWSSPAFTLTHAKAMVVDGRTAYVMTTNFSYSAFHANREFIAVDGAPADVRQVADVFAADWAGRPLVPRDPTVPLSPTDARPLLAALCASARHTLDLYAEEFQDPAMARLLARRARAGVRVRLLLPAPPSSGADPAAPGVALLRADGGQVRRMPSRGLYIHAKAIVADGREAFVGSENLSTTSLDHNREVGLFIADQTAIARLQTTFARDWRAAAPQGS